MPLALLWMNYKDTELVTNERHRIEGIFSLVSVQSWSERAYLAHEALLPSWLFSSACRPPPPSAVALLLSCRPPPAQLRYGNPVISLSARPWRPGPSCWTLSLALWIPTRDQSVLTRFQISCPSRWLQYSSLRRSSPHLTAALSLPWPLIIHGLLFLPVFPEPSENCLLRAVFWMVLLTWSSMFRISEPRRVSESTRAHKWSLVILSEFPEAELGSFGSPWVFTFCFRESGLIFSPSDMCSETGTRQ